MTVVPGKGNIYTAEKFRDFMLHIEFMIPINDGTCFRANGTLQNGNSGVYIQGCYEIQVLNSYAREPITYQFCGSVYATYEPRENACTPPGTWQTYDIIFRAAKLGESGEVTSPAAVTIIHNGVVVQNNVEFDHVTPGGMTDCVVEEGPIMLQAHDDVVHFRNIRIARL